MKVVDFNLTDVDGKSHRYEVELFSCHENVRLQLLVAKPLMVAIKNITKALLPAVDENVLNDLQGLSGSEFFQRLADALRKIDLDALPDVLGAITDLFEKHGGPELAERIFARTYRIVPIPEAKGQPNVTGHDLDPNFRQHMADPQMQDAVYGDGNFGEYWCAVAMVLVVNFTRHGRNGSSNSSGLFGSLMRDLLTPSKMTTEMQMPKSAGESVKSAPGS